MSVLMYSSLLLLLHAASTQLGVAKTLRSMAVYVASMASLTMNLPPISAAPRLWEGLGVTLG
jgi:hypothetical protein